MNFDFPGKVKVSVSSTPVRAQMVAPYRCTAQVVVAQTQPVTQDMDPNLQQRKVHHLKERKVKSENVKCVAVQNEEERSAKGQTGGQHSVEGPPGPAEGPAVTSVLNGNDDKPVKSGTRDQINEKKRKPGRKCSESMVPVYPG